MKLNDHLVVGLFIGITIGMQYATSLSSFMPIFLVLGLLYVLKIVKLPGV